MPMKPNDFLQSINEIKCAAIVDGFLDWLEKVATLLTASRQLLVFVGDILGNITILKLSNHVFCCFIICLVLEVVKGLDLFFEKLNNNSIRARLILKFFGLVSIFALLLSWDFVVKRSHDFIIW